MGGERREGWRWSRGEVKKGALGRMAGKREASVEATQEVKPPNVCFGCGQANPEGMHLPFSWNEETRRVQGVFRLGARYQGGSGMIHGGIIALILDEALGKVCRFYDARAVTAELTVEYLRPIRVDQEIHVQAHQASRQDRNLHHVGEIRDDQGKLLARGRGRFVVIDPDSYRRAAGIELPGGDGKV